MNPKIEAKICESNPEVMYVSFVDEVIFYPNLVRVEIKGLTGEDHADTRALTDAYHEGFVELQKRYYDFVKTTELTKHRQQLLDQIVNP